MTTTSMVGCLLLIAGEREQKMKASEVLAGDLPPSKVAMPLQKEIASYMQEDPLAAASPYELFKELDAPSELLAFHHNGQELTLTSAGFTSIFEDTSTLEVITRSMKNGVILQKFTLEKQPVNERLLMSGNGKILVIGREIFDIPTQQKIKDIPDTFDGNKEYKAINLAAYAPVILNHEGTLLVLTPPNGTLPIIVVDTSPTSNLQHVLQGSETSNRMNDIVYPLALSRDGQTVAGIRDNNIVLFNMVGLTKIIPNAVQGDRDKAYLSLNKDGSRLAYISRSSKRAEAQVFDTGTAQAKTVTSQTSSILSSLNPFTKNKGIKVRWYGIQFTNTGNNLCVLAQRKKKQQTFIQLWNVDTGVIKQTLELNRYPQAIVFSPNDVFLALGERGSHKIRLFKKKTNLEDELERQEKIAQLRQRKKQAEVARQGGSLLAQED